MTRGPRLRASLAEYAYAAALAAMALAGSYQDVIIVNISPLDT